MIFKQFLISLLISLLISAGFFAFAGKRRRSTGFIWFFLIIFASTWAGGLWISPFGPQMWGIRPAPYVAAGLTFGLIFTVVALRRPPSGRQETIDKLEQIERGKELQKATYDFLKIVFIMVLLLLGAAIATGIFSGI